MFLQVEYKLLGIAKFASTESYDPPTACAVVAKQASLSSRSSAVADLTKSSIFISLAFLRQVSRQMSSAVMSAGLTPPTLLA